MSNKMKMMVVLAIVVIVFVGLATFVLLGGFDAVQIADDGISLLGHCVSSSSVCTGVG